MSTSERSDRPEADYTERAREWWGHSYALPDHVQERVVARLAALLAEVAQEARVEGQREMRERAAKACDDEPELPGEPPASVLVAFMETRDPVPLLRLAVKVTKDCVSARIRALPIATTGPEPSAEQPDCGHMTAGECDECSPPQEQPDYRALAERLAAALHESYRLLNGDVGAAMLREDIIHKRLPAALAAAREAGIGGGK